MRSAWFLTAAVADVAEARDWYDLQRPGLGDEFIDAVDSAVDSILEFPDAHPIAYRSSRRFLLARFPYCLYYRVTASITLGSSWWPVCMRFVTLSIIGVGRVAECFQPTHACARLN